MAHVEQLPAAAVSQDSSEAVEWVRKNAVSLTAVALIAVQLWWTARLLSHFYFRQDDFGLMDHALSSGFTLKYLFTIQGGHLIPGGLAMTWLLVRLSLYDWTLISIVNVVLLAAASLALLRLLVAIFGKRPAILIPLVIYLFTPLTLPGLSFWATNLMWLPLQLTILMALGSHVRYLQSGRRIHAIGAVAWFAAGMLFDEQGILVPLFAFVLTSAYFTSGRWWPAIKLAARTRWRLWAVYGALTAGYLTLFLIRLQTSVQQPGKPGLFSGVLTLASTLLRASFVPAALGGPWHWYAPGGDYGYAVESAPLTQISWAVALILILASLWYRRNALRAWIMLAGWFLLADLGPLIISRVSQVTPTILGLDLHYLADSPPILALCVGLAFWPVAGEENPYRSARPPRVAVSAATLVLVGCFLAGSFWSGTAYLNETSSAASRSYIATARVALARVQPGTVIVPGATPQDVMYQGYLGAAAQTSAVLGPLAPAGARIRFAARPAGLISNLMIFDSLGRLLPAIDIGYTSVKPPARSGCWQIGPATSIPLNATAYAYGWIMQLAYHGPATTVAVQLGSAQSTVALPAGTHDVNIPLPGAGKDVVVRQQSPGPSACVTGLTVGLLYASKTALPLPFYPVPK